MRRQALLGLLAFVFVGCASMPARQAPTFRATIEAAHNEAGKVVALRVKVGDEAGTCGDKSTPDSAFKVEGRVVATGKDPVYVSDLDLNCSILAKMRRGRIMFYVNTPPAANPYMR